MQNYRPGTLSSSLQIEAINTKDTAKKTQIQMQRLATPYGVQNLRRDWVCAGGRLSESEFESKSYVVFEPHHEIRTPDVVTEAEMQSVFELRLTVVEVQQGFSAGGNEECIRWIKLKSAWPISVLCALYHAVQRSVAVGDDIQRRDWMIHLVQQIAVFVGYHRWERQRQCRGNEALEIGADDILR